MKEKEEFVKKFIECELKARNMFKNILYILF